jgi:ATP-binding cassette subfamily C protein LapB
MTDAARPLSPTDDAAQAPSLSKATGAMPLAEAVVALLRQGGVEVDRARLTAGLPVVDGVLSEAHLERALRSLGYFAIGGEARTLSAVEFPCCIGLSGGGYAVLISRDGGNLHVLDATEPEAYRVVPEAQMLRAYAGHHFHILPGVDLLAERHAGSKQTRHWFWGRLFLERLRLTDVVLASFLANILAVVTSLFALQVYDRVIPGQSEATLWVLASGVACAILFEALLRLSRAKLVDQMGKDSEVEITRDLFQRVVDMRMDRRPAPPAGIVHMVREFAAVKEFFTTASIGALADLPFVFIFLALIYGIAGNVVWVVVAGAILTVIPSLLMQRKMAQLSRETMGGMSAASRVMTEAAYGLESIKASRSEPYFQRQWEEIVALNATKTTDQRSLAAFQTFWAGAIQQATYVAALIAGVYLVFAGELTLGAIIAVSILSSRTLSPITQLSQMLARWQNMKNALDGLEQIMQAPTERDPERSYVRKTRLNGHVKLHKVRFSHPEAAHPALDLEGFAIEPGTRLALVGKNGSGKSTLLRVLAGLYQPTSGEVLLDGLDIRQIDPTDLRRNIGYLPQDIRMYRGTLRDNLATAGLATNDDDLMQALSFAGLDEFVQQHPEGLDLAIRDGGEGLSIGQRQSVGLARLYLQNPSIILLDEPTASLDQTLENALVPRIGEWIGNRTCVVATHRPQILSQMTRVGVMQNGRLAVEGDRDSVLRGIASKRAEVKATAGGQG